jgi:hypothetical protein
MYSAQGDTALPVPGFPIRVSAGQSLFSSSPRLIAAVHALHRLLVPRHPPCALTILTVIVDARNRLSDRGCSTVIFPLLSNRRRACCSGHANAVFKVRRGCHRGDSAGGLSKLSSTRRRRETSSSTGSRLGRRSRCAARGRSPGGRPSIRGLPRKEVIQPHLPVRLPCYDFTPIMSPTFDGSLP